jgi:nitroreductase
MKKILRLLFPSKLYQKLAFIKYVLKSYPYIKQDLIRYAKYSNSFYQFDSPDKYLSLISVFTHILEKGLIMPSMRIGFGQNKVLSIIKICNEYFDKYAKLDERLVNCIAVIKEYHLIHKNNNYVFSDSFEKSLMNFLNKFKGIQASKQLEYSKNDFFKHTEGNFENFAKSRHSVRDFDGEIKESDLIKAIDLANTAPSSCNRQSQKVYILKDRDIINKLLNIHKGSSGFGQLANKFLVVTYKLEFWKDFSSRNAGSFDSGIYVMNLLYALHFYRIAACILNSDFSLIEEKQFRKLLNIPEKENITCIIAIGNLPKNFKVALSERIKADSMIYWL